MLLQQFQQHLKTNFSHLSANNCKLLLAVSGGIDSVVMTDLFYKSGFDFIIAHCNFQLRGEESNRDETFVRSLAINYTKEIFVQRFDTTDDAEQKKLSIQEAARELRYTWFKEINDQQSSVSYISTAHNSDDNIETALMFFLRGSGIHGLTGIPAYDKERKIIRPLLFATRNQIEQYAKSNNIVWVEDASNATVKYTRNFLRNTIIPLAQQCFPEVKPTILNNINRFKEVEQLYQQAIQLHKKRLLEFKSNEVHIPVLKLQNVKPLDTIIWEIIKDYNFHPAQVEEVKKLCIAENSSYIRSSTHRIIKNRKWLIIITNEPSNADFFLIDEHNTQVNFINGTLQFEKLPAKGQQLIANSFIACLDAKQIEFPLLLRKWKQGDYFYPLGMHKKKKLSRFFIDQKLSAIQKENTWILESNKKIIWIINHRIDDRYKISPGSVTMLKIIYAAH